MVKPGAGAGAFGTPADAPVTAGATDEPLTDGIAQLLRATDH